MEPIFNKDEIIENIKKTGDIYLCKYSNKNNLVNIKYLKIFGRYYR